MVAVYGFYLIRTISNKWISWTPYTFVYLKSVHCHQWRFQCLQFYPTEVGPWSLLGVSLLPTLLPLVIVCAYFNACNYTRQKWDRDHFLENLSGYETSCAMVFERTWAWAYATTQANKRGKEIVGLYGAAVNRGQTEPAMVEILEGMKSVSIIVFVLEFFFF